MRNMKHSMPKKCSCFVKASSALKKPHVLTDPVSSSAVCLQYPEYDYTLMDGFRPPQATPVDCKSLEMQNSGRLLKKNVSF